MLLDHCAHAFLKEGYMYLVLITLGRLAFPLYAFLLAEGATRTLSLAKYTLRVFTLALISVIPYNLLMYGDLTSYSLAANVVFTLTLSLIAIALMEKFKSNILLKWTVVLFIGTAAEAMCCDYGIMGVVFICVLYEFSTERLLQIRYGMTTYVLGMAISYVISYLRIYGTDGAVSYMAEFVGVNLFISLFGLAAFLFMENYDGRSNGSIPKIISYGFYPLHLMILLILTLS